MNSPYISYNELFYLLLLIITLILPFKLLNIRNKLTFAHPLIFYSLIMFFYTVLTPIYQIANSQTISRGFDFRELYILGWKGALLSVISILVGYSLKPKVKKNSSIYSKINYHSLGTLGLTINIVGFLLLMIFGGFNLSLINPFYNKSLSFDFLMYTGGFKQYFLYGQDLLIPGNLLMFLSTFQSKKKYLLTIANFIFSILIYLNSGFRYRIFILFTPVILFLLIKIKLKGRTTLNLSILAILFILFSMLLIGEIRTYGAGFNFANLSYSNNFFENIFNAAESSVFMTTVGVINSIPDKFPFQNITPLIKTILHPIPSFLFNKNSGDYLFNVLNVVYGFKNIYNGAIYLNFGEYYLMFGWFGIFIFNFLLGYIFKRFWLWINLSQGEPLALMLYVLNVSYIFNIVSRGYIPQQVHLYIFILLPINIVYLFSLRRKYNNFLT